MTQALTKTNAYLFLLVTALVSAFVLYFDHGLSSSLRMAAAVMVPFAGVVYAYTYHRSGAAVVLLLGLVLSAVLYVTGSLVG